MPHLAKPNWRFCLQWVLATAIALALCNLLGPIGLLIGPGVLAIAQGYVLRRHRYRFFFAWGATTAIGGYGALFAYFVLFLSMASSLPLWVLVGIGGAILGVAQAIVLRGHSRYWRWWPLINAIILTISLGWLMPTIMDGAIYGSRQPDWQRLLRMALTGIIGGTLKGLMLDQVLRHQPIQQSYTDSAN